jgi:hypothetical protein
VERWLKAPLQTTDGEVRARVRGTPQGGVVSPLLANLFLHYAFDVWIDRTLSSVRFCRYADDAVIHCKSQAQAQFVLRRIDERFRECGLELHPNKTRIVYCKDINRQQDHLEIEFTFLGYTFRPRKALDKYGRVYVNFSPAVSGVACKSMRQTIRGWHLQLKCDKELADLSTMFDPTLKGWHQYYGRFYGSAMSTIWKHVNAYLVRWHWGRTRRRPRRSADATIREETLRNHRYCLGSPKTGCRNRGCEGPRMPAPSRAGSAILPRRWRKLRRKAVPSVLAACRSAKPKRRRLPRSPQSSALPPKYWRCHVWTSDFALGA